MHQRLIRIALVAAASGPFLGLAPALVCGQRPALSGFFHLGTYDMPAANLREVTSSNVFAQNLQTIRAVVPRTGGFSTPGELWIEVEQQTIRLFANGQATVEFEDGRIARYAEVRAELQNDVNANGPRRVEVHKNVGGPAFQHIRLLKR